MFKRRKVKLSTTAKIILDDNEKTAKPSNSKETESKSAAISEPQTGQGVDCSPSCVKKPKLDSSQSSSPKRSMKYVPPFTASKRFSSRLRLKRIDKEKNESKSSCQEAVKCLEGGGKNICLEKAKENLQKGEERSATVFESNEDKTVWKFVLYFTVFLSGSTEGILTNPHSRGAFHVNCTPKIRQILL